MNNIFDELNEAENTGRRRPRAASLDEIARASKGIGDGEVPIIDPRVNPDLSQSAGQTPIMLTYDQLMAMLEKASGTAQQPSQPVAPQQPPVAPPQRPDANGQFSYNGRRGAPRSNAPYTPQPPQPPQSGDTGRRVIYQSDDYDAPAQVPTHVAEYDDDDFLDDEETSKRTVHSIQNEHSRSTYTVAPQPKARLDIVEEEYSSVDLPRLRDRRMTAKPMFVPQTKPKMITSKSLEEVDIEEYSVTDRKLTPVEMNPHPEDTRTAAERLEDEIIEREEEKRKAKRETIRKIVLAIAILAIIGSLAYLGYEWKLSKDNENFENEVSNLIINVPTTVAETTTKKSDKKDKNKDKDKEKEKTTKPIETTLSEQQQWAQIKAAYPGVAFPEGMSLKYAKLFATNKHFVGYLEAPGTKLSLPIVQTTEEDVSNSYLAKNFYGKATKYGCPFVSSRNNISDLDYNTVIFGHHMNDGTIFGAIDEYKKLDGFKKAPVITFNTLNHDYSWKIIAAFITNDDAKDDDGYKFEYTVPNLSDDTVKQTFLNELAKRSLYSTGVDVAPGDKLLTLSTCSHEFENARFVVVARMVRPGEDSTVNTANAALNNNPRYPQAYCTKKKITNNFANDIDWYCD